MRQVMGDIINLPTETTLDIPADKVIAAVAKHELVEVVVVGWRPDGDLFVAASSASGATSLWLLERAKQRIMEQPDGPQRRGI